MKGTLKMKPIRIYQFTILSLTALFMTVACGKMEAGKTAFTTARGTAQVTQDGNPGLVAGANINIKSVKTVLVSAPLDFDDYNWALRIDFNHGQRNFLVDVFPNVSYMIADTAVQTIGSLNYTISGFCGDIQCNKFAVVIDVRDISSGTSAQTAQFWDKSLNSLSPVRTITDGHFNSVVDFYKIVTATDPEIIVGP